MPPLHQRGNKDAARAGAHLAPAWCRSSRLTSREPRELHPALISPLLARQPGEAAPEEVMRHPPSEAWPLARVLDALLVKMSRTACWLSHAMGRRQAGLGTPVPRTPTVAPGPKVRSGLASRQSQGPSSEHREPQKPAASVDAWRLIGCGRLRYPMLPRQLPDLTSPCDMQGKPSLPVIVGDAGWPSLAINGEGSGAPFAHPFLA